MLKKIAVASLGLLIGNGFVQAAVSGVYSGQSNGQSITITLQSNGQGVRGTVDCGGGTTFPLVGRENADGIEGIWRAPNGQDIPFAATVDGKTLQLQTNGATYGLTKTAGDADAPQEVRPAQQEQRPAAEPVAFRAEMERGEVFQSPVPQGWTRTESSNETWIVAPDRSVCFGFTGLEQIADCTPAQFLTFMATQVYKLPNFKLISAKNVACPYPNGSAIEATYSITDQNGNPYKSWARVCVVPGYGNNGYMLVATAPAAKFDQLIGSLKAMAEKIQIINDNLAFQHGVRLGMQANQNLNHPMDHSFADGYWKQQQTYSNVFARGSDVRTGNYVSTDPQTGTQYSHGVGAYDANGRVVNPERPTEYLQEAPHWQNWHN